MADPVPAPTCRHFGTCGGCTILDLPIAQQRTAKRDRVRAMLGPHVAGLELPFTDAPAQAPRHDRQRILYPVQAPDGSLQLGLYRRGSHDIVRLEECATQHPALTVLGNRAAVVLRDLGLQPYDETQHRGCARAFAARLAASTGELLLGLVTASAEVPGADRLARELLAAAADLPSAGGPPIRAVGVVHNVQERRGNALLGNRTAALWGRDHLFDEVRVEATEREPPSAPGARRSQGQLRFRVHFESFYQLHRDSDALLYRPALELLGDVHGLHVVDGFGGVGTFALRLAHGGASRVDLVELHPRACADARSNVANNPVVGSTRDRSTATVHVHTAALAEWRHGPHRPDLVVVDPTRAGLGAAGCERIRDLAAPRVLYVACGLPALARDLRRLPDYRVTAVRLADLFPHTDHVEILALLQYAPSPAR